MNALLFSIKIEPLIFDAEIELRQRLDLIELAYFLYGLGVREVGSYRDLVELIKHCGYVSKEPSIIKRVVLDFSLIPDIIQVYQKKKKYKVKGEIWDVHKSDVDPFPSSPHAHNYDQDLVLHLGNGKLYRKRDYLGKAKKKDFLKLRSIINNVKLPDLEI
jgi:hypothetical protein